ncbi:MAG: hypothetical protein JSR19_12440 [Proteobacteria bacterium]|nr:hypothetical protein [Pseudomonadota bacterium]HQR03370.1 hypothetical protein [Rhodocyclaceae bacterium]
MKKHSLLIRALVLGAMWGTGVVLAAAPCTPRGDLRPYCGFHQPEDLEPLADGHHLLVSQMNLNPTPTGFLWKPGKISLLDTVSGKIRDLYPQPGVAGSKPTAGWGDPSCPGAIGAEFSPHGIHLSRRPDGRMQLLVVNHGGREAVEFFEFKHDRLIWRGCAIAPRGSSMNDVSARPDGGFIVTNMIDGSDPERAAHALELVAKGEDTGFVWSWSPATGYTRVPGSEGPLPNGVQVDRAGKYFYYNVMGPKSEVRKVEIASGRRVAAVKVPNPDNLSWDGDRLLTAGLIDPLSMSSCGGKPNECPTPSHVTAIDPQTMTATRIFEQDGTLQSGVSSAVEMGGRLYIGAFSGDRVLSAPAK